MLFLYRSLCLNEWGSGHFLIIRPLYPMTDDSWCARMFFNLETAVILQSEDQSYCEALPIHFLFLCRLWQQSAEMILWLGDTPSKRSMPHSSTNYLFTSCLWKHYWARLKSFDLILCNPKEWNSRGIANGKQDTQLIFSVSAIWYIYWLKIKMRESLWKLWIKRVGM